MLIEAGRSRIKAGGDILFAVVLDNVSKEEVS